MPKQLVIPGRRICVVGTSGSGKTFVAEQLARILGLTYVCNDAIIWCAGWRQTPADDVRVAIEAATSSDGWTFDGNLGSKSEDLLVLSRCDTIVWLDLPRREVWSQVIRRTIRRVMTKEPLWHGNIESMRTALSSDSVVWWSIKTYAKRRRQYTALFAAPAHADRSRIRLGSRADVDRWLGSLG